MRTEQSIPTLVNSGLLLILCVMGAVLLSRSDPECTRLSSATSPPGGPAGQDGLRSAIEGLEQAVTRLLSLSAERTGGISPGHQGAGVSSDATSASPPAGCVSKGDGSDYRELLASEPKRDVIQAMLREDVPDRELLRKLAFRSYRSIIEEFGFPDNIRSSSEGVHFYYQPDGESRGTYLEVVFCDGVVVHVRR